MSRGTTRWTRALGVWLAREMTEDEKPGRARGLKALVHDAVDFTVDRVEDTQSFVARSAKQVVGVIAPGLLPVVDGLQLLASTVPLTTVRAVNRLIEHGTDPITDYLVSLGPWLDQPRPPIPMRSDIIGTDIWFADAAIGALNGAVGDYLFREMNSLDLGFTLRHGELPAHGRIAVFVHGLATTEWCWCWDAAAYHGDASSTFGTMLERDRGFLPVFARYNSGRHVYENGRLLAEALEQLCADGRVSEIMFIAHSMGGLVVRSACHHASQRGMRWVDRVSRSFSLGVPHQGAPLEKLGHLVSIGLEAIDHPGATIPAEILKRRSDGIRDLRLGTLTDSDWLGGEVPLLDHVAYYFIAATMTKDRAHPVGRLLGDVLVRLPSASGPLVLRKEFAIETEHFGGILHHQLQNHPDVYRWILRALGD